MRLRKSRIIQLSLILAFSISFELPSLSQHKQSYLIVTLERERNWDLHKAEYSYWIVPLDSLSEDETNFNLLYLSGFSVDAITSCCNEGVLNSLLTEETSFSLDSTLEENIESLIKITDESKRKVQSIRKNWTRKYREKITVYLSPVQGGACECLMDTNLENRIGISKKIFIPNTEFTVLKDFWLSDAYHSIKTYDFGELPFINLNGIL